VEDMKIRITTKSLPMRNVLIPTDITLHSLELVSFAARAIPDRINAVLFHAFDMPDSLLDAMIRSHNGGFNSLITEEIRVKCKRLKAAHSNISNISFKYMYGTTKAAFRNYVEANKIDMIVLPDGYSFVPVVRDSVNMIKIMQQSGIEILSDLTPHEHYVARKLAMNRS
jgi:hypothetical protein